jgi:hypothetical protein
MLVPSGMKAKGNISTGVKQMGEGASCSMTGVWKGTGSAGFPIDTCWAGKVEITIWVGFGASTFMIDWSLRVVNQGSTAAMGVKTIATIKMRIATSIINSFFIMDYSRSYF